MNININIGIHVRFNESFQVLCQCFCEEYDVYIYESHAACEKSCKRWMNKAFYLGSMNRQKKKKNIHEDIIVSWKCIKNFNVKIKDKKKKNRWKQIGKKVTKITPSNLRNSGHLLQASCFYVVNLLNISDI